MCFRGKRLDARLRGQDEIWNSIALSILSLRGDDEQYNDYGMFGKISALCRRALQHMRDTI